MKKTTLLMIVSIIMALTLSLGGSVAYLMAEDSDVNVMVMGNVNLRQDEWERLVDADGNYITGSIQPFTQDQVLLPAVIPEQTEYDEVPVHGYAVPVRKNVANYIDKMVTVTNTGKSNAYVRTIIAIPSVGEKDDGEAKNAWLHWNCIADTDTAIPNGWYWGTDGSYMWPEGNQKFYEVLNVPLNVDGEVILYDIFVATNVNILVPGESTAPSMTGVYLDPRVDYDDLGYFIKYPDGEVVRLPDIDKDMKILVTSQAVQADGFDDAWTALEAAFGDITVDNHPWLDGVVSPVTNDANWYEANRNSASYEIRTAAELAGLAELVNNGNSFENKTITLMADIDLKNNAWTPIGTAANPFKGTFNGNGKTIRNLLVNNNDYSGLFGHAENATLENVVVDGFKIKSSHYAGAVVGYAAYSNVLSCTVGNGIVNCTDTKTVSGESEHGNIANGDKAGAIAGYIEADALKGSAQFKGNIANECTVQANRDAGQLVGCVSNVNGAQTLIENNNATNVTVTWNGYGVPNNNITNEIVGCQN